MNGVNKYEKISGSIQENFSNKGNLTELVRETANATPEKPSVFLSHISKDKEAVIEIAKYFSEAGVDYYLDINDPVLQQAVSDSDDKLITECIEVGINKSTHLLSIISKDTQTSWWVPYEIGYAKKCDRSLALLPLKEAYAPSYLKIVRQVDGIGDLNDYIREVAEEKRKQINFSNRRSTLTFMEAIGTTLALKLANDPMNPLREYLRA